MKHRLVLAGRHEGSGRFSPASDDPGGWLRHVEAWFDANAGEVLVSQRLDVEAVGPVLRVQLHPAAEELAICAAGKSRVVISASTSAVGPGYHRHVCELLHGLGEALEIHWTPPDLFNGVGDPTGYFETADTARLEAWMLERLSCLAGEALLLRGHGVPATTLSSRSGHTFEHGGPLLTPMGPRDAAWLERVCSDPAMGRDVFPWWSAGTGAGYRLGRALHHLWTEMVWRPPLVDEERRAFREIARLLQLAWREDPTLDYPWHAWRELLAFLGVGGTLAEEVSRQASIHPAGEPIGYRRGAVQVALPGGWSVRIPGSLIETRLANGTWVARDHRRSVRFLPLEGDAGPRGLPDGLALDEHLVHHGARVDTEATVQLRGEGGTLTALCDTAGRRALWVFGFEDSEGLEWAKQTWRSIDAVARA